MQLDQLDGLRAHDGGSGDGREQESHPYLAGQAALALEPSCSQDNVVQEGEAPGRKQFRLGPATEDSQLQKRLTEERRQLPQCQGKAGCQHSHHGKQAVEAAWTCVKLDEMASFTVKACPNEAFMMRSQLTTSPCDVI